MDEKDIRNGKVLYSDLDTDELLGEDMIPDMTSERVEDSAIYSILREKLHQYLELDVAPADRARADMATDAFYALWDAIRKVSDDLDRLAGDCRVVDAIYAVNDVRRRVGTLKTED